MNKIEIDRPFIEYPIGTKAYAYNGGYWIKAGARAWKWHCGDTFPTPGADARWVELPEETKPISKMTTEEKNREVAEWLGIKTEPYEILEWIIGYDNYGHPEYSLIDPEDGTKSTTRYMKRSIPDFTADEGKVQLLREMMKREDFWLFMAASDMDNINYFVEVITDTTGKLLDTVLEWKRREKC